MLQPRGAPPAVGGVEREISMQCPAPFITRGGEGREDKNRERKLREAKADDDDDVVRCFIEATLKHSKAPGAVRASKKRYPFLHPVISRGCQG